MSKLTPEQKEILNSLSVAILVITKKGELVFLNSEAKALIKTQSEDAISQDIKEQLIELSDVAKSPNDSRFHLRIDREDGETGLLQVLYKPLDNNLLSVALRDISKEASLIKHYSFSRKELTAKNVLQDHKNRTLKELKTRLHQIYQQSPNDIVIIDKDLTIIESNLDFFVADRSQAGVKKCYHLLNYETQCDNCPIASGEDFSTRVRVGHAVDDQYMLEIVSKFQHQDNYLLIIEDTTKKIELIERIREQQETIQDQKDLFADLVDVMLFMHKSDDMQKISDVYLENILLKTAAAAGAILVEGHHRSEFWIKSKLNIKDDVFNNILDEYIQLSTRTRSISDLSFEALPGPKHKWHFLPIQNLKKEQIGVIILDFRFSEEKEQILTLYKEPLTTYLANTLLTEKLKIIAHTDGLTGLYNRYYLMTCFGAEEDRFKRLGIHFSVVLGDVNGLKPVNDRYGHEAGDKLLLRISDGLKEVCRKTDVITRLGGDEFCILLPDTDKAGTEIFIQRLESWYKDKYLDYQGKQLAPLSISLGYASTDTTAPELLMKTADKNMFDNKKKHYKNHERYR